MSERLKEIHDTLSCIHDPSMQTLMLVTYMNELLAMVDELQAQLETGRQAYSDLLLNSAREISGLQAQLEAVREMEVPTGYSAKFTHGWGVCLQTVKAMLEDK